MKKAIFLVLLLFFTAAGFSQQEAGIHFIEGEKWNQVLKMAQEQNKYIFMDCYTSWCGPCKALSKDIFTLEEVGDFFNARFVNVKYDMEKGEGKELKKLYENNIIGYPTLLLIDKDGKVVHQMAGFQQASELIAGMKAGMEGRSLFAYRERYVAGQRDLNFIKAYVNALNGAFLREDVKKVVGEYVKSIPVEKLQEKEVWELVGEHIKNPYSPQFEYVVFNLDKMAVRLNFDRYKVERQLSWALEKALNNIIEPKEDKEEKNMFLSKEPGKMDTLMRLIDRASLKHAEEYRAKSRIYELLLKKNWPEVFNYLNVCRDIRALGYSERYVEQVVRYMALNCRDRKLLKKSLTLMEELQAREEQNDSRLKTNYYGTLALLNDKLGNSKVADELRKKDEKIKAEKAKEFEEFMKKN